MLFRDLDFTISTGQALFIQGKNGSGKTSLLRIICGLLNADSGNLSWCGSPYDNNFYQQMAYVGHSDGLKKELTVLENLQIAQALGGQANSIGEALATINLTAYDHTPTAMLSAGQRRRLSLARLLVTDKILWLLDEPFTAIDKIGVALVQSLLQKHIASGGMLILSSHQPPDLPAAKLQTTNLSPCH